ncbi:MAG: S4 domain-containing protein [Pseudomonadota bacterium]
MPAETCRLDVWLFRTRLCKTRGEAQAIIAKKKLRLTRTGETARVTKPHFLIRPGDRVSFMRHRQLIEVEMLAPGTRRGPATEARSLYLDLTKPDTAHTSG